MASTSKYEETRLSNINALLDQYHKAFGRSELTTIAQDENINISKRRRPRTKKRFTQTRRSARIRAKTGESNGDDSMDECLDEDCFTEEPVAKKRCHMPRRMPRIVLKNDIEQRQILQPENVTDDHIASIWYKSSGKKYDSFSGTTCHQCRQKTKDTKSVCRNNECFGVRGQFCGFCLKNRYGEDVATVLKDPNWFCPPCREICNCSICRTRDGKVPTGILAPYVKSDGFNNVKDYLEKHEESI